MAKAKSTEPRVSKEFVYALADAYDAKHGIGAFDIRVEMFLRDKVFTAVESLGWGDAFEAIEVLSRIPGYDRVDVFFKDEDGEEDPSVLLGA